MNAYQTPWKRLVEFYDIHGQDHTSFMYTFPHDRMGIEIIVHHRISLGQFRRLLRQFYLTKAREDVVQTDDIEIRVTRRPTQGGTEDPEDDDVIEETD
ncbi:hypothetical protein KCU71_g5037, partial [Aureobasidium melanogenum]